MCYRVVIVPVFFILAACSWAEDVPKAQILTSQAARQSFQPVLSPVTQSYLRQTERFPVLPKSAGGVLNVRNYGAKGDGVTDDTQAFKQALERDEIANQGKIIYIPNGTYLLSDTISWPRGSHEGHYYKRTTLLGESREGAVIKLQDQSPAFSTPEPKPVIDTQHNRANGFRNTVENLTINTGSGNSNAIGVRFNSNNGGGIFNVSIVSHDGQGSHGIDLTGVELGPLLVKQVEIKGFNTGIRVGGGKTNSITMEDIVLRDQRQLGIDHAMQTLTIRNLASYNQVPVILTQSHSATLVLIGAELEGRNANNKTAIETRYREDGEGTPGEKSTIKTFLANIKQQGYQRTATAYNCDTGVLETLNGNISEWTCGKPLQGFSRETESLKLPIRETPNPSQDLNQIAIVQGNSGSDIQAAIDTPGVKTVFLPNRTYQVDQPIVIRGSVKKIIGMRAFFSEKSTHPIFRFDQGDEPIVSLERLEEVIVEHNSKRTLVIKHAALKTYTNMQAGTGDVFFEDVVSGPIRLHRQTGYARSLNVEAVPPVSEAKILNDGGTLWILGLKTENQGTIIETKNNGKTEVLGGFIYINASIPDTSPPQAQYVNDGSQVTILTTSYLPTATGYPVLVREKRNEITTDLVNLNRRGEGRTFPYIGY